MDNSLIHFLNTFKDDKTCEEYFIKRRFPTRVYCVYCKNKKVYIITTKKKCQMFKCSACKQRFSVITGTIFESTKLGLRKWFLAFHVIHNSSKGISSIQLSRYLNVTQRTAWFILNRFREIAQDNFKIAGTVEMDETFIDGKEANKHESKKLKQGRGVVGKVAVMGAISREEKQAVAYPVTSVNHDTVALFRSKHIDAQSNIIADECTAYDRHTMLRVNHSEKQYGNGIIHTNSIESFWAIFKRGYTGVYHWMSKKHLKRYVNEFTYRYNNKQVTLGFHLMKSINKRLKYKVLTHG